MSRRTGGLLLAFWIIVAGARAAGPPGPPAPADGVHDDAAVLSGPQRTAAVRAVADARAAGVSMYVALYRSITGETIEERAERLKAAWCPEEAGLLVVADTGTNQCTYLSHVAETGRLSAPALQRIFSEASAAAAAVEGTSADKMIVVIENLVPRLRAAVTRPPETVPYRFDPQAWMDRLGLRTWEVAGGGALAGAGLLALILGLRRRRRRQEVPPAVPVQALYFPTVVVGQRFGAPCGGGVMAEVRFRGPAEAPDR